MAHNKDRILSEIDEIMKLQLIIEEKITVILLYFLSNFDLINNFFSELQQLERTNIGNVEYEQNINIVSD